MRWLAAWSLLRQAPQVVLLALVKGYRLFFKAWLGNSCRFEPTCSAYALTALERHGALRGSSCVVRRVLRCHPWCAGGHDPVPPVAPPVAAGLFSRLGLTQADTETTSTRKLT